MKKQTSFAERQYQKLDNGFESNKKEEDKTKNKGSRVKSNLVHNNYFTFYKYFNIKEFSKRFLIQNEMIYQSLRINQNYFIMILQKLSKIMKIRQKI